MKNLKWMIIVVFSMLGSQKTFAQTDMPEYDTAQIQTSAICGQCKERLEHNIAFEKGVKSVELDDSSKVLTIVYKEGKNDKEKLKIAVTKIGYDADDLAADPKAYNRLPDCCKKDNEPH
jgi:cation transport ATPase